MSGVLVSIDVDAARAVVARIRAAVSTVAEEWADVAEAGRQGLSAVSVLPRLGAHLDAAEALARDLEARIDLAVLVNTGVVNTGAPPGVLVYPVNGEDTSEVTRARIGRLLGSRMGSLLDPDHDLDAHDVARFEVMARMLAGYRTDPVVTGAFAAESGRPGPADVVGLVGELTARVDELPELAVDLMRPVDLDPDSPFTALAAAARTGAGLDQVAATRRAFANLSTVDQALVELRYPWLVGNLDGIPYPTRIAANHTAVVADLHTARGQRDALAAQLAELEQWPPARPGLGEPAVRAAQSVWQVRALLAAAEERIARNEMLLNGPTQHIDDVGRATSRTGHQVVLFDPANGRFAELVGSLDARTTNIGILVPGTGANEDTTGGQYDRAWDFVRRADPPGSLAMVTYLGGPMPQEVLFDAVSSRYATNLAAGLRDFAAGVDRPHSADVTVLGHSYGGSVVGAAEAAGMIVDRVVHVESAGSGPGVWDTSAYADPDTPRYSMTAPGDLIASIQGLQVQDDLGHGADPDLLDGVVRLETGRWDHEEPASGLLQGPASHSGVFTPGSTAWVNMLNVLTGKDVWVYQAPVTHIVPAYPRAVRIEEYPMEDPDYTPPTQAVP